MLKQYIKKTPTLMLKFFKEVNETFLDLFTKKLKYILQK